MVVRTLRRRDRVAGAAKVLGAGLVLAAVVLPIPLVHLFAIPVVAVSLVLAARRLWTGEVVARAEGKCPSCGQIGRFYVGFGRQRFRLPIATSCAACASALTLSARSVLENPVAHHSSAP